MHARTHISARTSLNTRSTDLQLGAGVEIVSRWPSFQSGEGDIATRQRGDVRVLRCAEDPGLLEALSGVAAVGETVRVPARGTGNTQQEWVWNSVPRMEDENRVK